LNRQDAKNAKEEKSGSFPSADSFEPCVVVSIGYFRLMSVTIDRVFEDALCLTDEGRILLAERLLESIPPDKGIFDAQVSVAVSRADELKSGAVKGINGADALRQVRESIQRRSDS
jgi:Putative addiction module component